MCCIIVGGELVVSVDTHGLEVEERDKEVTAKGTSGFSGVETGIPVDFHC